jgi:predicted dehydrogenase
MIKQAYEDLTKINLLDFSKKSVLIIGAGYIANQYAIALSNLKIKDVTILGKSKENLQKFKEFPNFEIIDGGYERNLSKIKKKDLVIIAIPIEELTNTAKKVIENGHSRILIEKPGSVFKNDLLELKKIIKKEKVRIAYNRFFYPSFHKLLSLVESEGGITSCKFDFTEWLHTIEIEKYDTKICNRWGISNSLHVISMVLGLIGMPKKISTFQMGSLEWHPTGSIFVGNGISEKDIPFSYHANWGGGGRWGIEVITKENIYRLIPLEKLFVSKKGSIKWEEVNLQNPFLDVKEGIAEEIATMLNDELDKKVGMISLTDAIEFNEIAEEIFGYKIK